MAEPILIWGAGAIGGTLGAYWALAGNDVLLVDRDLEHVEALRTRGLTIDGPIDRFTVDVPAVATDHVEGQFRRIVLAVKAQHTAGAVAQLESHVTEDGFVLSAQNGLNEITIARELGEERTMGAFVNFGADRHGPGRILFGNRGAVVVGELDGSIRPRTHDMHEMLRVFEPDAVLTDNIWGYLWAKLAYGAMLFATALTSDSMADNFAAADRFPVWRRLGAEVMATAAARGVTPVGFDGFDPASFALDAPEATTRRSVADLAEFNRGSAKTHSGVWRDLAVHRRRTEVDAQIGAVAELAADVGVETPAIRRLVALVHEVETGRRPQSLDTFEQLMAVCR